VTPPPEIETHRLLLRGFEEGDASSVGFFADPDVMRYIPGGPGDPALLDSRFRARLVKIAEQWTRHGFGMWAIVLKESGSVIGQCGLGYIPDSDEVEVYYLLDKPYWSRGIATEATIAALAFGFERAGLERIVAIAMPENVASRRVMEKSGMRLEGAAHHYDMDCVKFALTRQRGMSGL
jgi:RimJ/RimL family protein N-acetyltransferase